MDDLDVRRLIDWYKKTIQSLEDTQANDQITIEGLWRQMKSLEGMAEQQRRAIAIQKATIGRLQIEIGELK